MAGTLSDFLELELLDHVFGNAAYTAPATIYFGLWTSTLNDASTGATAGEVSGTNYSRASLTNNATNFPAASAGAKSNGVAVTFATPGAGGWGTVTFAAALDAATIGNMLAWSDVTPSEAISEGNTVEIAIGDFDVTLT